MRGRTAEGVDSREEEISVHQTRGFCLKRVLTLAAAGLHVGFDGKAEEERLVRQGVSAAGWRGSVVFFSLESDKVLKGHIGQDNKQKKRHISE